MAILATRVRGLGQTNRAASGARGQAAFGHARLLRRAGTVKRTRLPEIRLASSNACGLLNLTYGLAARGTRADITLGFAGIVTLQLASLLTAPLFLNHTVIFTGGARRQLAGTLARLDGMALARAQATRSNAVLAARRALVGLLQRALGRTACPQIMLASCSAGVTRLLLALALARTLLARQLKSKSGNSLAHTVFKLSSTGTSGATTGQLGSSND